MSEIAKQERKPEWLDTLMDIEKLTARLNQAPEQSWLQDTPDKKAKYIPVAIIENQLREDFAGLVQFKLISERRELNEYIVTASILIFHPVIRQWMQYDGIGAVQIMQKKDTDLATFSENKVKNALQMNAPKAYAEAIKNAAKKIGVKYGSNLNRKFEEAYEPEYTITFTLSEVADALAACQTEADLMELWYNHEDLHKNARFKLAFSTRKQEIKNGKASV